MSDKSVYVEKYRQFHFNKALGQHFLTNDLVVKNMVEKAGIRAEDTILEIGPGLGILSHELIASPAREVILCEKDEAFAEVLKKEITSRRAKIIKEDALVLIPNLQASPPFKVISNLPYNISSPVVTSLLTMSPTLPQTIIVMLQKEVAERLVAKPGDSDRGIVTVLVECYGQAKIIDKVSKNDFYPSPKVDSAVLMIENIQKPEIDAKKLLKIVKMSFAGKRKKIKNSLFASLKIPSGEALEIAKRAGFSLDDRPEDLTVEQWKKLFIELGKS